MQAETTPGAVTPGEIGPGDTPPGATPDAAPAPRTATVAATHRAINVITASGSGYVISSNTIGFASSGGTGVTIYTGAVAVNFTGHAGLAWAALGLGTTALGRNLFSLFLDAKSGDVRRDDAGGVTLLRRRAAGHGGKVLACFIDDT